MEKLSKALVVKYQNELNNAQFNLETSELRIIFSAISKVNADNLNPLDYIEVKASDLEIMGTKNAYRELKAASESLFKRSICFKTGELDSKGLERYRTVRWVGGVEYCEGDGTVKIRFDSELGSVLTKLDKEYTRFLLNDVAGLRSVYANRIYSMLMQFAYEATGTIKNQGWFSITIDELRYRLGLENKMKLYGDLKRSVLETAVRQINESDLTRIFVDFEEIREKRRVVSIKFTFSSKAFLKSVKYDCDVLDVETVDLFYGLSFEQAKLSAKQISMYADFLSGMNKKKVLEKSFDPKKFLTWLKTNEDNFKIYSLCKESPQVFKEWLEERLGDPNFVMKIYDPFLKSFDFKPKRKS